MAPITFEDDSQSIPQAEDFNFFSSAYSISILAITAAIDTCHLARLKPFSAMQTDRCKPTLRHPVSRIAGQNLFLLFPFAWYLISIVPSFF